MKTKEPPYTERYVRWCGRSVDKIIIYLLPDCTTGERNTNQLINEFEQTLEEKQDERTEVEKEQTTVSKEEKAILKEGSIIGIIEIPGIDIRYPVMEETGSEMLNAGTGNNAFCCQVQI